MSSKQEMLDAMQGYLDKVKASIGAGGEPLFFELGVALADGATITLDLKTVLPNHANYDLTSVDINVRILDQVAGSPTQGYYISNSGVLKVGVTTKGIITIKNNGTNPSVILYQVTTPTQDKGVEPSIDVVFLGEQPAAGFIDGTQLASQIGLTAGTAQHSDSPWLHFILDDLELYIAKKPYRYNLSWEHINAVDAVFGTKTVTINDKTYKVRLLKSSASAENIYNGISGFDPVGAYGSEWNRLFYPIHSGNHIDTDNPSPVSGEGIQFGTLAQYTDADLVVHHTVGSGSYSWCQETRSDNIGTRLFRGLYGISHFGWTTASFGGSSFGWRPVLELVE